MRHSLTVGERKRLGRWRGLASVAISFGAWCLMAPEARAQAWVPPLGIPAPPFGINEQPGAVTLVANSGQMPSTIAAGAVVEVRGNHSDEVITCNGTAASPVFIVGGAGVNIAGFWEIRGSYCILHNLRFTGSHELALQGHHQAVRNSESIGTLGEGPSSALSAGSGASDVVFYNNNVHDHGNLASNTDQDAHCISISAGTTRAWIVDNETYKCSGDGININPYPYTEANRASIRFVYIGRNKSHDNKQTGIWAKMGQDIVVSQNEVWNHRPGNSSYGQCVGFQYGTERAWYLFNLVHDCNIGIAIAGDLTDAGPNGQQTYMIGNVIYSISGSSGSSGVWADAAIQITGGTNHTVLNNTMSNVSSGVHTTRATTTLVSGNIFADVAASGSHLRREGTSVTANTNLSSVAWRGDVACSACVVGTPGFVSPGFDFRLQSGSLAIDRGTQNTAYSTFYTLYGIDISFDAIRSPRPQGANWDIGAYEGTVPPPPPLLQGRFYTISPCRALDTRAAAGPALLAGLGRNFKLTGVCGIPLTAKAVSANIAVTQPTAAGNLRFYAGGLPAPNASTINYRPAQTRANNAILFLGVAGDVSAKVDQGSGTVHLFVDLNGYFQ